MTVPSRRKGSAKNSISSEDASGERVDRSQADGVARRTGRDTENAQDIAPTNDAPNQSSIMDPNNLKQTPRRRVQNEDSANPPPPEHFEGIALSPASVAGDGKPRIPSLSNSSSPRAAEDSGRDLFSPNKQSNQREEYDALDLNNTIMGEGIEDDVPLFQFNEEGSPCRDFSQSSPGNYSVEEQTKKSSVKKRVLCDTNHPGPAKRPHGDRNRHLNLSREGAPENVSSDIGRVRASPRYQRVYGHAYTAATYHTESRTPTHGKPHRGAFHPSYSPYYYYYSELPQWDKRSLQAPISSTSKISFPTFESDDEDTSAPTSPRATTNPTTTPEPSTLIAKSPFRSPRRDPSWGGSKSNQSSAPSPFLHRSPGMIGNLSFEMGTPSGTLPTADYSPMGPSYEGFEEEASTPLGEAFSGNLMNIDKSPYREKLDGTPSPSTTRLGGRAHRSPLSPYITELFNQPTTFHGDSRPSSRYDYHQSGPDHMYHNMDAHPENFDSRTNPGARKHLKASAVTVSGAKGGAPSSRLDPAAQPKQLWPTDSDNCPKDRSSSKSGTSGLVRLELGGIGSVDTRKKLEGINNMMQQRSANQNKMSEHRKYCAPGYDGIPSPREHFQQNSSDHAFSLGEMTTPRKTFPHLRSGQASSRRAVYQPHLGPRSKPSYSHKPGENVYSAGISAKRMYMGHPPQRDGAALAPQHPSAIASSYGKENNKKKAAPKRSPCNCKKSRCLKLYCECFAAERFCQGCNCSDCRNTPEFKEERDKAIKDTKAKNSKAFQSRFVVKNAQGPEPTQKVHNMGCKCKKSACLKKYCECFNAGVFCGAKCKCADCLNYAGSQQLVDKRNKMKDRPGAEYALRASHERWKSGNTSSVTKPLSRQSHPSPAVASMHPHPRSHPRQGTHGYHRHHQPYGPYMLPPPPMIPHGHPPMPYPPMAIPITPGYHRTQVKMPPTESATQNLYRPQLRSHPAPSQNSIPTPMTRGRTNHAAASPRTPGVRKPFDPATNRKKRKVVPGEMEPTEAYFGNGVPEQPKITALAVFSFLSNDDLYHASLVCWRWSKLAMDEELWKFQVEV